MDYEETPPGRTPTTGAMALGISLGIFASIGLVLFLASRDSKPAARSALPAKTKAEKSDDLIAPDRQQERKGAVP